jgi:hypothetical protein
VAHENDSPPARRHVAHLAKTLALKVLVADRQHLVDNQDFAAQVRRDGEGQAHVHAAAVMLHRRIEKALNAGEGDDRIELFPDLRPPHAEDGPVQKDVLAAGEFLIESRADLQEAAHPAVEVDGSFGHLCDAGQNFQQRAFSGAIAADQPEHVAALDVEADVPQRPELLARRPRKWMTHAAYDRLGECRSRSVVVPDRVFLAYPAY